MYYLQKNRMVISSKDTIPDDLQNLIVKFKINNLILLLVIHSLHEVMNSLNDDISKATHSGHRFRNVSGSIVH